MTRSQIHDAIRNLNRDKSGNRWNEDTKSGAPHKPFLLLSIMDEVAGGFITRHKFRYTDQLGEAFFSYWHTLFQEDKKTSIALPLYHMKSEPFWDLIYNDGDKPFQNSPSLGSLNDRVDIFKIAEELFELINDPREAQILRSILLETYFSDDAANRLAGNFKNNLQINQYTNHLITMAAEEPFIEKHSPVTLKEQTTTQYIRDKAFSKAIRTLYEDHCAICSNRVITPEGHSFVDGAHIIPWSESYNDDPRNGLSLCKTHHWMFDKYMLTINSDFMVITSKYLISRENVVSHLDEIDNRKIRLPNYTKFYPIKQALEYHNDAFKTAHKEWK